MGYFDLSVIGSDSAADLCYSVGNKIADVLTKDLKDPGNSYNTDGITNVAMIFDEVIIDNKCFCYNDKLNDLASKVIKLLEQKIKLSSNLEDWNDKDNMNWHIKKYKKLHKRLTKYLTHD